MHLKVISRKTESECAAGVTIKKTSQVLVFGIYNESVSAGEANTVVENMGDYLIEQGF